MIALLVGTLGVIGCDTAESNGNDAGTGGAGGTGGTGGTGGGNGGPVSTCDAICAGTCVIDILDTGIDPSDPNCESNCAALQESFANDDCGDEMQAYLDCAGPGPDCIAPACADLFNDWDACAQGS
jgi:hypothetical protein